jgi:hypothetical protein
MSLISMGTDRRTVRALSLVGLVVMAGCAGRAESPFAMTMPSPDGCFIRVWDAPRFAGAADFINGPRNYPTLRDFPGGRLWNNRIRSASAGQGATVTLWTDENFQGVRLTLSPETDYRQLPESVAGRIESMNIDCPSASAD